MKDKQIVGEHRQEKACLCRLFPNSKLFLKATHQHDSKGQAEYKCRMCGRVVYQTA
ncbi:MAG: hypothetical protein M3077_01740 [Candidatus Dormibacteraeota bacterium]|nr:hypothetical protein [Candidatus Dormibacteraeota bacterium]